MKSVGLILLACVLVLGAGCAVLDGITGVGPDGDGDGRPDSVDPSGGVVGAAGRTLGGLPGILGIIGTLLGAAGTAYASFRSRRHLKAAKAIARGAANTLDKLPDPSVTPATMAPEVRAAAEKEGGASMWVTVAKILSSVADGLSKK